MNQKVSYSWSYNNQREIHMKKSHILKLSVWSCFSKNGFGLLYFLEEILDSKLMLHIYKKGLIPSIEMLFGDNKHECIVVEDNDPKHKSKICQNFKSQKLINVLHYHGQPIHRT